ncbi:hypothetical protein GCK32_006236 [Trichostrongylus colubriformis]|uniref:Uncharacterized protein n=1 Tax=Trichostrongylus colubriformis TaxID=6319 RepID=A0AAN8G2E7_TRICO
MIPSRKRMCRDGIISCVSTAVSVSGHCPNNIPMSAEWLASIVTPNVANNMATSKSPAHNSEAAVAPLIIPKPQATVPPNSTCSVNIFRMILNEGQRTKPIQPIIDLEADVPILSEQMVTEGPVAKKRKEMKEDGEVSDDSESTSIICLSDDFSSVDASG